MPVIYFFVNWECFSSVHKFDCSLQSFKMSMFSLKQTIKQNWKPEQKEKEEGCTLKYEANSLTTWSTSMPMSVVCPSLK